MPIKVNQIVFLEDRGNTLYGEVIQLIPRRNLCWFRPICLVVCHDRRTDLAFADENVGGLPVAKQSQPENRHEVDSTIALEDWQIKPPSSNSFSFKEDVVKNNCDSTGSNLIDLQSSSDLLWPAILFQPALDTEAISLLAKLGDVRHPPIDIKSNYKYLNKFVQQFWRANQDKF